MLIFEWKNVILADIRVSTDMQGERLIILYYNNMENLIDKLFFNKLTHKIF